MNEIKLEAHAKINLSLKVKGKRADGYHEIESLMQKLDLADEIHLKKNDKGVRLHCPGSDLPENEKNLAYKAAIYFMSESEAGGDFESAGVDITLVKKIPVAAGLGGGSSDAAAVMRGLNTLFQAKIPTDVLMRMAVKLGADVPFFVTDFAAAWASGIGEKLEEAESLPDYQILLVNPGFLVSTKWVYENFALTSWDNTFILARSRGTGIGSSERRKFETACLHNDLEAVTIKKFPELNRIKKELQQGGADGVLMSGSGPTIFGLFADNHCAIRCYDRFARDFKGKVFLTKPYQLQKAF